ncbi:hypothetical protein BDW62DRAFT_198058 [Aspergillus aurantiobrunneus]
MRLPPAIQAPNIRAPLRKPLQALHTAILAIRNLRRRARKEQLVQLCRNSQRALPRPALQSELDRVAEDVEQAHADLGGLFSGYASQMSVGLDESRSMRSILTSQTELGRGKFVCTIVSIWNRPHAVRFADETMSSDMCDRLRSSSGLLFYAQRLGHVDCLVEHRVVVVVVADHRTKPVNPPFIQQQRRLQRRQPDNRPPLKVTTLRMPLSLGQEVRVPFVLTSPGTAYASE